MEMWVFVPLILFISAVQGLELIAVQSIFRHGDRAPSNPHPKDQVTLDNWPNGWSQLTGVGAKQCQELGTYYNRQYFSKLHLHKQSISQQDVVVRSTSKTRAIESAQNVLTGLFGRNNNLPEIHVTGEYKTDLLLKPNSVKCQKYDRILIEDNNQLFAKYDSLYGDFFTHLSDLTGYNTSMQNIDLVYDSTYREFIHGLSKDQWLHDYVLNKETGQLITYLDLILELKRIQRLGEFNSIDKSRLRTGYLLGHIVGQLKKVGNGELLPKLTLYSSHDATLTSLLYSLNASNDLLVPYSAAISLELYVDGLHMPTYYIKTLYRNETGNDQAHELQIDGCDRPACELTLFTKVLEKAMFKNVEEQQKECE